MRRRPFRLWIGSIRCFRSRRGERSRHGFEYYRHGYSSEGPCPLHPTYSSWLNQVELWFSKIERDVIARVIFTSVKDLRLKITNYVREYSKTAKAFKWGYRDPSFRITADSTVTVH